MLTSDICLFRLNSVLTCRYSQVFFSYMGSIELQFGSLILLSSQTNNVYLFGKTQVHTVNEVRFHPPPPSREFLRDPNFSYKAKLHNTGVRHIKNKKSVSMLAVDLFCNNFQTENILMKYLTSFTCHCSTGYNMSLSDCISHRHLSHYVITIEFFVNCQIWQICQIC